MYNIKNLLFFFTKLLKFNNILHYFVKIVHICMVYYILFMNSPSFLRNVSHLSPPAYHQIKPNIITTKLHQPPIKKKSHQQEWKPTIRPQVKRPASIPDRRSKIRRAETNCHVSTVPRPTCATDCPAEEPTSDRPIHHPNGADSRPVPIGRHAPFGGRTRRPPRRAATNDLCDRTVKSGNGHFFPRAFLHAGRTRRPCTRADCFV